MSMAGREGEPELSTAGPVTSGLIGHADLIEQAQRLGQQHRAAGIAPFGDAGYVSRDAGSARLLDALGATSPTTGDNAPGRHRVAVAYCDALDAREASEIEPGS
jgi:hypothetical protein